MPVACHVPSAAGMRNRDLVRHRQNPVCARTAMKNSVHGVPLHPRALPAGTPFSAGWVRQVRAPGGYRIGGFLGAVDDLSARIARGDARIRAAVRRSPAAGIIKTVPGVGDCTALVLDPGTDDMGRFVRAAKLCAHPGLVPSVGPSGESVHYGPITRRGSPIMRRVLTECVHSHVRYTPNSDVSVFYKRLAKKRGPAKAVMAAALMMLKVVYRMLRENRAFVQNYGQEAVGNTLEARNSPGS